MNRAIIAGAALLAVLCLSISGCRSVKAQQNAEAATSGAGTGPQPTTVEPDMDANNFKVDHPERFPLATAGERVAAPELNVTGVVNPDVSRQVPVPSLATGRIVEINARLGDQVTKGQLLFKVRSNDIAGAFANYLQALHNEHVAADNERLTTIQLN